jgi:hypothetical protein
MDAVPDGRPEDEPDHDDANKNQAIRIEFYNSNGKHLLSCIANLVLLINIQQT